MESREIEDDEINIILVFQNREHIIKIKKRWKYERKIASALSIDDYRDIDIFWW